MLGRKLLRRCRFSLATLLVAPMVMGAPLTWFVWQRQIVMERNAVKQWVYANGGRQSSGCASFAWDDSTGWFSFDENGINWARRMFGDAEYGTLGVRIPACTPDERARFERAFPESRLWTNEDFRRYNLQLFRAAGRTPPPWLSGSQ